MNSALQNKTRWPAEWEPHEATLLSWPHNRETWPRCFDEAESAFVCIAGALYGRERVEIIVADAAMEDRVRRRLRDAGIDPNPQRVRFHHIATNDAWVRDYGPIGILCEDRRALLDFGFNAWGDKYPPWDLDASAASRIAEALGVSPKPIDFILEGGSIDGNGRGVLLTTESCLLNPNRGPRQREQVESLFREALGVRQVLWLAAGIAGDDTDGHIDDIARFVGENRIAVAVEDDPRSPNFRPLEENFERLRRMRTAEGHPFELIPLPMPEPVFAEDVLCPASYANFYIANGVVLVPVFDVSSDETALGILRTCFPEREIVGISARALVVGLGAIHCLTQQIPRVPRPTQRR